MGKTKGTIEVPAGIDQDGALAAAKADERIGKMLEGQNIVKVIWVPGKILNVITPKQKKK